MIAKALVDSNVIIAALAEAHEHHRESLALFANDDVVRLAVSAHSYAECYSTLTRRADSSPFRFPPDEAWAALASVAAVTDLIGLTPAQTLEGVRSYAQSGGIGARLYDRLIGEAARVYQLPVIVTWNKGHLCGLFPDIEIRTPAEFLRG